MKFIETDLNGAYTIELEAHQDHRGAFARTFCVNEFEEKHLRTTMVQSNLSHSKKKHTIRGMHYQIGDAQEAKLVRCVHGRILDVIIDIRRHSATFGQHIKIELTDDNNRMLYVPEGFANGFITLVDDCHVFYQVSNFYSPEKERGLRWNDPFFAIEWPCVDPIISDKDRSYGDFQAENPWLPGFQPHIIGEEHYEYQAF